MCIRDSPIGAPHDGQRASNELLRRERDDENVVYALVESRQLRAQVAPPRQSDDWNTTSGRRGSAQAVQELTLADIHVDDGDVRLPLAEHCRRLGLVPCNASLELAMTEGKPDDFGKDGLA